MPNIIVKQGYLHIGETLVTGGPKVERKDGTWVNDENGALFAAYRDEEPFAAAVGWNPEVAVRNLLKMEEEHVNESETRMR